ncbi:hypothetical protein MMPV_009940 [Pyropia vietnamensis]
MVSTPRQMAFVPAAGGCAAGLTSRRPAAATTLGLTIARPLGRVAAAAAARRPARRVGGRVTPMANVQPGDRTKDGEEVVVATAAKGDVTEEEEDTRSEKQKEIDRLKAAEKFIEIDEGNYECPTCNYVYEPRKGEFLSGIKSGTAFADLPADFRCPSCKTPKSAFVPIKKVIAGFADNQNYGIGTNSLTGGQKSALIYGSLAVFFLLFLSGYLIN